MDNQWETFEIQLYSALDQKKEIGRKSSLENRVLTSIFNYSNGEQCPLGHDLVISKIIKILSWT